MKKNKTIVNQLLICLIIIILCSLSILFFEPNIEIYILASCGFVLIVIGMMICYLQKDSLPVIINLTSTSSEIMQALLIVIIILLSIYVIPINYFIISVILILLSIFVVPVFAQKSLVISSKGIRYVCKWNLKWLDINTYNLDKENGILNIQVKNGENKQIRGIKRKHYSIIETSIDNYLNSIAIV